MTKPTTAHRCTYVLWVKDRWVSVSECHKGQTVDLPAPTKPGRAA